ncbi:MAG: Acg family FMN-binding oxidoreductase [Bacteroides thetaiotaomicron]
MKKTIYAQNSDFLFMIEQAIKAPSGHNTQPWLFKINDANIEIYPNLDKSLPVVDFDNRELFISLGCATENLCIAASHKGYETFVSNNKEGVITIELTKCDSVTPNPLFEQIAVRQTNRSEYNRNIIPIDTIEILQTLPIETGINVHFYKTGTQEFDTISNFVFRGNVLQMQDEAFKKELKQWMRYNKKHQNETNDGLSYAVFGAPNLPKFIIKPIMSKAVNEKSQNKGDKKKIESSSHFILFTTNNNTVDEWINLGRSLERFLLKSTELGIVHAYLNQPNEIRELSEQMAELLNISGEYTTILLRIGYGEKMPYSKRKGIENVMIE